MREQSELKELSRQSLVTQVKAINDSVHRYLRQRAVADARAAARAIYRTLSEQMAKVPFTNVVEYFFVGVGLLCIYLLDVLLFGASAEYIVSLLSGELGFFAKLAKYAVPAVFLGIEILIASKIEAARHEERFEHGSVTAKRLWFAAGVVMALVMPLAARATAESAGVLTGSGAPTLMIVILGIISLIAHVLVLFGGRVMHEAKTYLAFVALRGYHERRARSAERLAGRLRAAANNRVIQYFHDLRLHNERYSTSLAAGPFDTDVLAYLRTQFPYALPGEELEALPDAGGDA